MWKREKSVAGRTGEAKAQNLSTFKRDDRRSLKSLLSFFSLFNYFFLPLSCPRNVVSSMDLNPLLIFFLVLSDIHYYS